MFLYIVDGSGAIETEGQVRTAAAGQTIHQPSRVGARSPHTAGPRHADRAVGGVKLSVRSELAAYLLQASVARQTLG